VRFSEPNAELLAKAAQIVFLALPHGVAVAFAAPLLDLGCQVIDLSADFRLKSAALYKEFYGHDHPAPMLLDKAVYGLPEFNRQQIKQAALIASPGCYPTGILLLSGVSGAGRKAEADFLFVECNESVRPYGIPKHRHLSEIEEQLTSVAGAPVVIQFTPHLIPINRGILTTLYLAPQDHFANPSQMAALNEQVTDCFATAYGQEPFVRLLPSNAFPDTKNVAGTNVIEIAWRLDPRTGRLILMSALDNLTKGASGQAVQSMNILCGFPETTGLT
jgi:N-acetyl-gamma-glutamyl-phosphate reductase